MVILHVFRALLLAAVSVPSVAGEAARTLYDDRAGIAVPRDFGCIHHVGLEICWPCLSGNNLYFGPDPGFNARVNTIRLYGMGGLEWGQSTEKRPGQYDWKHWDSAFAKLRAAGVRTAIYTIYNPPPFYNRHPHDYSKWRGQLPTSREALEAWLAAITTRYPEIQIIEVANEVFGPTISSAFWTGTEQELMTLSDWVLDWRKKTGWKGRIWSPSIPGVIGNVPPFLRWLKAYPRTAEFDAIPAHFYHTTAQHLGKPAGKANHWTALAELRQGLREAGFRQPIVDGEKGFNPGEASAAAVFNYGVKALLEGVEQVCYFNWGSLGNDETNIGQPFRNPDVKKAFEDLSALAGKRIVRVEEVSADRRWIVHTVPAASQDAGGSTNSSGSTVPRKR